MYNLWFVRKYVDGLMFRKKCLTWKRCLRALIPNTLDFKCFPVKVWLQRDLQKIFHCNMHVNGTMSLFRTRLPSQYLTGFGFPIVLEMIENTILYFLETLFRWKCWVIFARWGRRAIHPPLRGLCLSAFVSLSGNGIPLNRLLLPGR